MRQTSLLASLYMRLDRGGDKIYRKGKVDQQMRIRVDEDLPHFIPSRVLFHYSDLNICGYWVYSIHKSSYLNTKYRIIFFPMCSFPLFKLSTYILQLVSGNQFIVHVTSWDWQEIQNSIH